MDTDAYVIATYLLYGLVSVGLTMWLARTLSRDGAVFLEDVLQGRRELAVAINRLLVVGFCLLFMGYALLLLRVPPAADAIDALETVLTKLGLLLVSLGVLHFLNMYVMDRLRRRAERA